MARRTERVNVEWETPAHPGWTWDHVHLEVLMDIRRELQKLNAVFACRNFLDVPATLRTIERNTAPKKRTKK